MRKAVSILLHWNTDYAEIPRKELPIVIDKSFKPMVDAIDNWREGTICFNLTGHTIQTLSAEAPELIEQIKTLAEANVVEMVASGYSHPILPLLPIRRIREQIKSHIALIEDTFEQKPIGFWPPEIAVSPTVLKIAKESGIEWTYIDHEHFQLAQWFGNDHNPYERRDPTVNETLAEAYWAEGFVGRAIKYWNASRTLHKAMKKHMISLARLKLSELVDIKAFLTPRAWSVATQFGLSDNIPSIIHSEKKQLKHVVQSPLVYIPLYCSDIEFFGYRGLGNKPPTPDTLIKFLTKLKSEGIDTVSPSQIPDKVWPEEKKFIGTGSWSPDTSLRIWTESEDNREYTRRLSEIYTKLEEHKYLEDIAKDHKRVIKLLRIAENSDPRGWQPIPERKHEAYTAILQLEEIVAKL